MTSLDYLNTKKTLCVDGKDYHYYSLPQAQDAGLKNISRLPYSLKVLLK